MKAARMGFQTKILSHIHKVPFSFQTNLSLDLLPHISLSQKLKKLNFLCVRANKNKDLESISHPITQFPSSPFGDHFLSILVENLEYDVVEREIESEMKPKVRDMLMSSCSSQNEKIHFIYLLISLGISHHFETEIEEILNEAFGKLDDLISKENDLETISIMFEVFRIYGHKMSSDVFDRFKDDEGKLKESVVNNVRGMLQLYQVSHLTTTSDDVMEEVLSFTRNNLKSLVTAHEPNIPPHLSTFIQNALDMPRYRNIEILVVNEYISFYEQEEGHDKTLLKFAKLNFNYCKMHYIQELKTLTKWWKEIDLASKVPFQFRDKIVELYFGLLGIYFEPRYSVARVLGTKISMIMTVVDDTYDAYASLDEVTSFTDSLQRWDLGAIENLPTYMRILFQSLWEVISEIEQKLDSQGRSCIVQQTIDEIKSLSISYMEIAKWAGGGHVPSFEEYMKVGVVSAGMDDMTIYSFLGMKDCNEKIFYEWFDSKPKILQALCVVFRLRNDIATFEEEIRRGEVANGVNCYMKQHCVTKEETVQIFKKMVRDHYKIMMDEFFTESSVVPRQILLRVLNIARVLDVYYKEEGDGFGHPDQKLKHLFTSLFL